MLRELFYGALDKLGDYKMLGLIDFDGEFSPNTTMDRIQFTDDIPTNDIEKIKLYEVLANFVFTSSRKNVVLVGTNETNDINISDLEVLLNIDVKKALGAFAELMCVEV